MTVHMLDSPNGVANLNLRKEDSFNTTTRQFESILPKSNPNNKSGAFKIMEKPIVVQDSPRMMPAYRHHDNLDLVCLDNKSNDMR